MRLTDNQFLHVIEAVPLVSIDLVVRDSRGRILMGRRVNRPAQGKWFVPGGRIYKNEDLDSAFRRICKAEIGHDLSRSEARFIAPFTHIYDDNFMGAEGIGTHYVVLAYEIQLTTPLNLQQNAQHSKFRWFAPDDIDSEVQDVHENSRAYFKTTVAD